jgi:hypothetical protein
MSINLDECFAMVRNGELELWIQRMPDQAALRQNVKERLATGVPTTMPVEVYHNPISPAAKERTGEIIECFKSHALEVFMLLDRGDVQVCMSPEEHRQSYRKIEEFGEDYYRCDACTSFRDEQITMGPIVVPTTPGPILDFQQHQKRKKGS